jgi:signal transduction histidine kinase
MSDPSLTRLPGSRVAPILAAIARTAARLCDTDDAQIYLAEGATLRLAAQHGARRTTRRLEEPFPLSSGEVHGRAVLTRRVVHVRDLKTAAVTRYPQLAARQRATGVRTLVAAPLLSDGAAIGAIMIRRRRVRPFTAKQIALLRTFADQAVIAIENARLFTELQEKNQALTAAHAQVTEALEQQTATSQILGVISRSPIQTQPVFDAVVASAARLCEANDVALLLVDGDDLRADAGVGPLYASLPTDFRIRLTRGSAATRAVLDRATIHVRDFAAESDEEFPVGRDLARRFGHRTILAVPLLREGAPIGVICAFRMEVRPFPEQQIALLRTFADQAVIAIENVRLFTELEEKNRALTQAHGQVTEALEQQTATSDILRVISRSPTDLQPVFDTIVSSAVRLCGAAFGGLQRLDGDRMTLDAQHGVPEDELVILHRDVFPLPLSRETATGRAILDRAVIHIPDIREDPDFRTPRLRTMQAYRTILAVPLLRDGAPIGALALWRSEVRPFSEAEIGLVQTFADQAVIAMENVRLFKELEARNRDLTEALDRQTATADILRAISQAQTDVQPVFEAITDSAMRLLGAGLASMALYDGEMVSMVAARGGLPGSGEIAQERLQTPHRPHFAPEQAVITKRVHHVKDVETDPSCDATFRRHAAERGFRSFAAVPMLRGNESLGMLVVSRAQPGGFSGAEVTLLQTFADQAVIAVENTRLLAELQARTADLTRSVDQLTALGEVGRAVSSTLDLATVLTTIVSRAVDLSGLDGGVVFEYDEEAEEFVERAQVDTGGVLGAARRGARIRKGDGVVGRTAITLEPVQVADIAVPGAYVGPNRENLIESGIRALVAVPMVREGELIGCLGVSRNRPGDFPAETIELLRTFATQSALAIQNARLFHEIADKSAQLEAASRHKSEFLANMSHELRTPLNAVIGFSEVLLQRMFGELNDKQDEYLKDIYASGQHLLSLINDILDLSKIEAGRMELAAAPFHLPAALGNAVTLLKERAGRHGIALELAVDERLGEVVGDERKIKQVVLNLLSNAVKFTPEGGQITLAATVANGEVRISVTDTGIGIAPEDQAAIFEEFRQVGTAAKKVEGTGLGLALAKRFVELHGGRLWVDSAPGAGSTFTFTLPLS